MEEFNMANKQDLINAVAEKTGFSKKESTTVLNTVLNEIESILVSGDKLQLIGFGNFEVRQRSERKGRNPQTGEEITIPASKVPAFKPGKELKDAVK